MRMEIKIKDINQLLILKEALSWLSRENGTVMLMLMNHKHNPKAKKELDKLLKKRELIDDLLLKTMEQIPEIEYEK